MAVRRTSDNHMYWCEVTPPNADGRWSWLVERDGVIVCEGTARWRWLAKSRAEAAAGYEYMEEQRRVAKRRKRKPARWQPNL